MPEITPSFYNDVFWRAVKGVFEAYGWTLPALVGLAATGLGYWLRRRRRGLPLLDVPKRGELKGWIVDVAASVASAVAVFAVVFTVHLFIAAKTRDDDWQARDKEWQRKYGEATKEGETLRAGVQSETQRKDLRTKLAQVRAQLVFLRDMALRRSPELTVSTEKYLENLQNGTDKYVTEAIEKFREMNLDISYWLLLISPPLKYYDQQLVSSGHEGLDRFARHVNAQIRVLEQYIDEFAK